MRNSPQVRDEIGGSQFSQVAAPGILPAGQDERQAPAGLLRLLLAPFVDKETVRRCAKKSAEASTRAVNQRNMQSKNANR